MDIKTRIDRQISDLDEKQKQNFIELNKTRGEKDDVYKLIQKKVREYVETLVPNNSNKIVSDLLLRYPTLKIEYKNFLFRNIVLTSVEEIRNMLNVEITSNLNARFFFTPEITDLIKKYDDLKRCYNNLFDNQESFKSQRLFIYSYKGELLNMKDDDVLKILFDIDSRRDIVPINDFHKQAEKMIARN